MWGTYVSESCCNARIVHRLIVRHFDSDYGCLTFLLADSTRDALQVFLPSKVGLESGDATGLPRKQGDEEGSWITADPIPGCLVCNIGAMWETWTGGLYRSTLHRVVHRGSNYRVS